MTSEQADRHNGHKAFFIGFVSLGLLVGSIAGLSSAELTLTLFGFLFAFVGGSILAFIGKIPPSSIGLAGTGLAGFCLAAIIALYGGIFIKVNEFLYLPQSTRTLRNGETHRSDFPYRGLLRTGPTENLEDYLKEEIDSGDMTLVAACKMLSESPQTEENPSK